MPHVWTQIDVTDRWEILPLAGECCLDVSNRNAICFVPLAGAPGSRDVRLLPPGAAGVPASWSLLAGRAASLRVNGHPLVLGIRALRDKDELSIADRRWFFSSEELACVSPFPGLAQPACCPRCKQKLEIGDASVACPLCHAWHHQTEKFPCWTYDATCALCQLQSTALDAGYSWTPETL